MTVRHFLDLDQFDAATLRHILDLGVDYKEEGPRRQPEQPLAGKVLAMIFESPSTRTRVSFDVAVRHLGGESLLLNGNDMQLGRGETVADTARVLSRYVDAILLRTQEHAVLLELARYADVPVINGLTRATHPCQLMADIMTFEAHRGPIAGRAVAWVGDGNNVATSWIHAAARFGFELRLACPDGLGPPPDTLDWAADEGATVSMTATPDEAVAGADCVVTDTWISMGDQGSENRHDLLTPYRVDERLMELAGPDAIFMHCLPAHRGEEVAAAVIDGPRSVVWDEAENRLHSQKGILMWCLG